MRNEPERPPPANDDAAPPADLTPRNEPSPFGEVVPDALGLVDGVPLLDGLGRPRPHPLAAADWRVPQEALEAPQGSATAGAAQAAGAP